MQRSVFIHIELGTNYHNKNYALRLALKERLRRTRKWPTTSSKCPKNKKCTYKTTFFLYRNAQICEVLSAVAGVVALAPILSPRRHPILGSVRQVAALVE